MTAAPLSVLTLVKNRESHLRNLIRGLSRGTRLPDELVVIRMNEQCEELPDMPFPCQQIQLSASTSLPLATARNVAANAAAGKMLVFLDVDCIPGNICLQEFARARCLAPDAVFMGGVFYLQNVLQPDWTEEELKLQSSAHRLRDPNQQTFLQIEPDFNLFWTLSFAVDRQLFQTVGGFCEEYQGYGAEDTDFARLLEKRGIELRWVPTAAAYHQYHQSQMPPYQHLDSIVRNAQVYYNRWRRWPMEKWLALFAQEGLIQWSPAADTITRR